MLNIHEFVRAHGHRPSGEGNWAFCLERHYERANYLAHVVWYRGDYRKAARAARRHFGLKSVIVVCS
jgi:hypothetical protein